MMSDPNHPGGVSRGRRLLLGLVSGACRRPLLVLTVALVLAAASIYAACTVLEYQTERSDLISPRKDYQQRWRKYLAEFGDDNDIVVVVQGSDRPAMERALETLAGKLQRQPALFDRLFYKVDLRSLHNRALLFLPTAQVEHIQADVRSMEPLLEYAPLSWRSLSLRRLLCEAKTCVAGVESGKPLSEADTQFLTQLLSIARSATATLDDPAKYSNPWSSLIAKQPEQKDLLAEPQYFFSGDGSLAFLLVRPVKKAGSFTAVRDSVEAARAVLDDARSDFPALEFGLTGLPVLENDEMVAAQRDTRLASWLAIAGVTLLFFIVYRSLRWVNSEIRNPKSEIQNPRFGFRISDFGFRICAVLRYPLLTVGTLLIGTAWALGWTTLTVGHMNILSATFAVMLIGMGDYGVLWVMRYEQERRQGASVEESLRQTAICVGGGTLTAALTTALAFYAAMLADFQGVAELGWIAGSGVLLCALSCFTVLPAFLKLVDRRCESDVRNPKSEKAECGSVSDFGFRTSDFGRIPQVWLPSLPRRAAWVVTGCLLVTLGLAYCGSRIGYDHNLLHLQAHDLDSVKWQMTLIKHTAGASWHAESYTRTPAEALALKARYEQLPSVSRVVEIASLVPADQDRKVQLLGDIQRRLHQLPEPRVRIPHDRPDSAALRHVLADLNERLGAAERSGHSHQALLTDLRHSLGSLHDHIPGTRSASVEERLRGFDEQLAGDLAADLHRLRDVSTPAPITLDDLPPALRERYIGKSGQWLLQVFGKEREDESLWDFGPLERFTQQVRTIDAEATGKPFGTVEGLRSMKEGFQWAGLYAFVAIVAVLLFDFRSPRRTLIALAPLAMGITMAVGILGLFGVPLNPANMIALPLILGVGVDNGVHVLHDYLAPKAEGRCALSRAIGRGVLVKALTTMIGFGTLMISRQPGLAGLGLCLTLGVACCMVSSLVFLPALLCLLSRRKPETRNQKPESPAPLPLTAYRQAA
jgi:hopanoid biosynthesis associated RND transporter like protein HpnN